jgi:hypothetical protein
MASPEHADAIRSFVARHRFTFELLEDPLSPAAPAVIVEKETGKTLRLPFGEVLRIEEARDSVRNSRYLRILLEDGRSFALAGLGFVFAPSFVSTGPVPDCPDVASFADFARLFGHLSHLVAEVEAGREKEALQVLMVLLAFLDGARAIGLDVGPEERALEAELVRLEERGVALR